MDTKHGPQVTESPLSFQLNALDFNFTVVTNLEAAVNFAQADSPDIYKVNLPYNFPDLPDTVHVTTAQENFIETLRVICQECINIEERTGEKKDCDE